MLEENDGNKDNKYLILLSNNVLTVFFLHILSLALSLCYFCSIKASTVPYIANVLRPKAIHIPNKCQIRSLITHLSFFEINFYFIIQFISLQKERTDFSVLCCDGLRCAIWHSEI